MITKAKVKTLLATVLDPELGINIVDLGLVYGIEIRAKKKEEPWGVKIVMTLTTPGCPLGGWFVEQVKQTVATGLKLSEDQVMVEITFEPPWTQELMSEEAREQMGFA